MRILFLHQFDLDLASGSGTYLRLLTAALIGAGHAVDVVSARRPDRFGLTTCALPFDFTLTFGPQRRPQERTFDELSMPELSAHSRSAADCIESQAFHGATCPDLVLANHMSMQADIARHLCARRGIPYRIISYGTDTQLLLRDRRYVDWLLPAIRQADRLFAISKFVAVEARKAFPGVEVDVLGGAVDKGVFRPAGHADAGRVAFVGRLVTEKGLWTLLDAIDRLEGRVVLDIVGEGPLIEPLRDAAGAAARSSPGRQVNVLGYLPPEEVRAVLVRAAVLVVPSVWDEPLGLVVLEAMACGVPVVATAVGGIPEIVQHGRNGLLVEPGDPECLAQAIASVLGDRALRRRLSDHCLAETAVPSHVDLVERVLA